MLATAYLFDEVDDGEVPTSLCHLLLTSPRMSEAVFDTRQNNYMHLRFPVKTQNKIVSRKSNILREMRQ